MTYEFGELNTGFVEIKAQELALSHVLSSKKPKPIPLLIALPKIPNWIENAKKSFNTADINTAKVAEWIFDNSYVLERSLQKIKIDMPEDYYKLLPSTQSSKGHDHLPRAYHIASGLLAAGGIQIAMPILVNFIQAYQKESPLDIAELWALPTLLRLACIELVMASVVRIVPELNLPYKPSKAGQSTATAIDDIDCLGRALHCLSVIETIPWRTFFEQVSVVEKELRNDPAGVYAHLDFESRDRYCKKIEKLARATSYSEEDIARCTLELADETEPNNERESHVGFWLVDDGQAVLEEKVNYHLSLKQRGKRLLQKHAIGLYLSLLVSFIGVTEFFACYYLYINHANIAQLVIGSLLALIPASMLAVSTLHWTLTSLIPPRILNKLDFDKKINPDFPTAIVIPTLLGSIEEIDSLLIRIERHYLSNTDPALHFVLLTDYLDAAQETEPTDNQFLGHVRQGIIGLNDKYRADGKAPFHLLHRERKYNASERCWMGWERKRGKLDEFNHFLRDKKSSAFSLSEGDSSALGAIRFVITLDSDTQLSRGMAARLIGTLAHPLNRAVFDDKTDKIIAGYSIIQPRIEIAPSRAESTWFSRLASGDRVIDIYSQAVSNVYQDLFGCGIFVGKGIYDVSAFTRCLQGCVPENTVLSHDLFEGIKSRVALASDIVLYEDFPNHYLAFTRRLHRWIRGDWQLLPWLKRRVRLSDNSYCRNDIDLIERWKIFDNLRRSVLAPALLLWLMVGWIWLPGNPLVWTALALIAPVGHQIGHFIIGITRHFHWNDFENLGPKILSNTGRWLMLIVFLPHEAIVALDAVIRTLFRITISQQNLLQWLSAAHTDKHLKNKDSSWYYWREMAPGILLTCLFAIIIFYTNVAALPIAAPFLILWLLSPEIARLISQPIPKTVEQLDEHDVVFLRRISRRTWLFFETFVGPADHWLPPDNYQEDPHGIISHRTSPTNIGMMFLSNLTAWDFGYIGPTELVSRVLASLDSLSKLEHYRGHIFNWYDTQTLEVLLPRYVSTVDSGNLAAALLTLNEGCKTIQNSPIFSPTRWDGLMDTIALIEEAVAKLDCDNKEEFTTLCEHAAQIRNKAATARDNNEIWWLTIQEFCEYDFIEFDRHLVNILAKKSSAHGVTVLRNIRVWVGRAHAHLRDMQRDLDRLFPWLTMLTCPSTSEHEADALKYHDGLMMLRRILRPTLPLAEISPACVMAKKIILNLREEKPHLWNENPDNAISVWLTTLDNSLNTSMQNASKLQKNLRTISKKCLTEVAGMDFRLLYDEYTQLFHIGFNDSAGVMDPHHYDLLASEARLASIVAMGKGDIPTKHWFALGRSITKVSGQNVLISWGGTMFEYLMPRLLICSAEGTLLAQSEQVAVDEQIRSGEKRSTPWGISESGYSTVDIQHNYQYRAFGVPSLGFKRGLELDTVIAPYATALALAIYPQRATDNLKRLSELGMLNLYGMYEAIDYTPSRLPLNREFTIVRSHMAHHQGMIFVALANVLFKEPHLTRFQRSTIVQTVDLLLHEQLALDSSLEFPTDAITKAEEAIDSEVHNLPHLPTWKPALCGAFPEVHVLGNGRLNTLITDSGAGGLNWRHNALTRWLPDTTLESQGVWIYLRDEDSGEMWSVGRLPMNKTNKKYDVVFHSHMVEFHRQDHGISLRMDLTVSANDDVEIRRITLINDTQEVRRLTITTYAEVVLTAPSADQRHPAFSKLFIHSELAKSMNALVFERRSREPNEKPPALMHRFLCDSDAVKLTSFETDRAHFMGRNGSSQNPQGLRDGLSESLGWTLDPIMSLQATVELSAFATEKLAFVTIASSSRRSLFEIAHCYEVLSSIDLVFHDALFKASLGMKNCEYAVPYFPQLQNLLSVLMQSHAALRVEESVIKKNKLNQSALWAFGISGDFPILLFRLHDETNVALLRVLMCAHQQWHIKGLEIDFVIIHEGSSGYIDEISDKVQGLLQDIGAQTLLGQRGGVHLLHLGQMSLEQGNLLRATAHAILSDHDSLDKQIISRNSKENCLPTFVATAAQIGSTVSLPVERRTDLVCFNGTGGFSPKGDEYVIYLAPDQTTPAPWSNVLANENFGCLVSESGGGYTWAINSGENRLTHWANDPVKDRPSEVVYIRDEETGQVWTVTPDPIGTNNLCEITHGAGYSQWRSNSHHLEQALTVMVAHEDPVKITRLALKNTQGKARRLTVTYYAELVLGAARSSSAPHIVTEFDPKTNALLARNVWNAAFSERMTFLCSDRQVHGFTGDRSEFLGREGGFSTPEALERWGLSGSVGAKFDPCAALQIHVDVPANGAAEVLFLFGQGDDPKHAQALIEKWQQPQTLPDNWKKVRTRWSRLFHSLQVKTPEPSFNLMMNQWLLYQTLVCRIFARCGLYQSSGAYGFRDQLQDVMALVYAEPAIARKHIIESAAHQFDLGDVLHWWHPPMGRGVRTHFSDDLLWLPYVTAYYVDVTGDKTIFDEQIPFLTGEPLGHREENRYTLYEPTSKGYSLFEHCKRALNRGINSSGKHGLLLMGAGDWNDGMDRIGARGRGESIWLSWFAIAVIESFTDIHEMWPEKLSVSVWRDRGKELAQAIEKSGWDGKWYRRAYDDEGQPWGSAGCQECRIDSIAQSWATLSGAGDPERAAQALQSAQDELVDEKNKVVLLLTPPFDATMRDPGYIKAYPPGIRENGGQYTHAAIWLAWALTRQGDGDGAMRIFRMLNPIEHSLNKEDMNTYKIEPYVIAADIGSVSPHAGRGGWSWYTGSSSWAYRLGVEAILGINFKAKHLVINPCIPKSWLGYNATLTRDNGVIELCVEDNQGVGHGVADITVNGEIITGNKIPLPVNDEVLNVVVRLGITLNR
jgi:cyclic beta-1,2-glucan synthetase